jgi:(2Fe-2S) ferredoxin
MRFEKHIFVCINERADGARKSCGQAQGMELVAAFKKRIKENNLKTAVRAQRCGCLDACEWGPTVAVYPDGVFYGHVQVNDVDEIFEQHVLQNKPVLRLLIDFKKPVP